MVNIFWYNISWESWENKEEILESIRNSDTFPLSKKYLKEKLNKMENNDWKISKEERKIIENQIKNYGNLETKFEKYRKYVKNIYKKEINKNINELHYKFNMINLDNHKIAKLNTELLNYIQFEINELKIIELFNKYFDSSKITGRQDINSVKYMKILYNAIYNKEITRKERIKILEYWYYIAFKKEINTSKWRKWLENIIKYQKRWGDIFYKNLKNVIKNKEIAKNIFLLSWVEWNWLNQEKNNYWAEWWFQILFSTAKKYWAKKNEDLYDPIKSAEIASKYLSDLIKIEKEKYPNLDINEIINKSITKYNWNFTERLNKKYREDIDNTIYLLYKELNRIKKIKDKKDKLQEIHDKFFINDLDWNSYFPWKSHFSILEKQIIDNKQIDKWIDNYIKTILKQQNMYPIQFNAFKKLYEEKK